MSYNSEPSCEQQLVVALKALRDVEEAFKKENMPCLVDNEDAALQGTQIRKVPGPAQGRQLKKDR
eukprot:scaffold48439_cov21-Tisochrysis_lutea.AAC.2